MISWACVGPSWVDLRTHDGSDVLGPLRFGTELGHRAQVDAFHLGRTIQPHPEEGLVKLRLVGGDGQGDVLPGSRGAVRDSPCGVAELLEDVRLTASDLDGAMRLT